MHVQACAASPFARLESAGRERVGRRERGLMQLEVTFSEKGATRNSRTHRIPHALHSCGARGCEPQAGEAGRGGTQARRPRPRTVTKPPSLSGQPRRQHGDDVCPQLTHVFPAPFAFFSSLDIWHAGRGEGTTAVRLERSTNRSRASPRKSSLHVIDAIRCRPPTCRVRPQHAHATCLKRDCGCALRRQPQRAAQDARRHPCIRHHHGAVASPHAIQARCLSGPPRCRLGPLRCPRACPESGSQQLRHRVSVLPRHVQQLTGRSVGEVLSDGVGSIRPLRCSSQEDGAGLDRLKTLKNAVAACSELTGFIDSFAGKQTE